jgi:hypothetical protein
MTTSSRFARSIRARSRHSASLPFPVASRYPATADDEHNLPYLPTRSSDHAGCAMSTDNRCVSSRTLPEASYFHGGEAGARNNPK